MEEELLIRFIEGRCSEKERELILSKAEADAEFKKELLRLKNIYVRQGMPQARASEEEYNSFMQYAKKQDTEREKSHPGSNHLWRRVASWSAAAVIIILLALNLKFNWLSTEQTEPQVLLSTLPAEKVNTLYTAKGVKGDVLLPDGTKVMLNSDSKISYPARFEGSSREVEFTGEGFFEVVKDSLHPMVVRCNRDFRVEVYGTKFNIRSYNDDIDASTTLISGNIRVVEKRQGHEIVTNIKPNQAYVINDNTHISKVRTMKDPSNEYAWKEGRLIFESTPLEDAAKIMERWHGVEIIIQNNSLRKMPISANFTTESLFQIMDLLKFSAGLDYEIKDNTVYIK